ncbi:hypothetical protein TWF481_004791 [Arthrobotrys musiformis]|uniref:Uncharacterized protein n=1 Tax=Arthrobotrys musiformis TaxID=47236 RepID=A0AAV9WKQ5_9PEZI
MLHKPEKHELRAQSVVGFRAVRLVKGLKEVRTGVYRSSGVNGWSHILSHMQTFVSSRDGTFLRFKAGREKLGRINTSSKFEFKLEDV